MSRVTLLLLTWALSACTSISRKQCASGDWENVGRIDGFRGYPLYYAHEHEESCRGVARVDQDLYKLGWEKGRIERCEPGNAFELGSRGIGVGDICPDNVEAQTQNRKGISLYIKTRELAVVNDSRQKEKERIEKDESVVNHVVQAYNLIAGRSPTQDLDDKAATLEGEVTGMRVGAPPRTALAERADGQVTQDALGTFAGVFAGFGIGHAIQGRYREDGWKWTLGEAAVIGGMVAAVNSSCGQANVRGERECQGAWVPVSVLAWVGYRIWQGADLWNYTKHRAYGL